MFSVCALTSGQTGVTFSSILRKNITEYTHTRDVFVFTKKILRFDTEMSAKNMFSDQIALVRPVQSTDRSTL